MPDVYLDGAVLDLSYGPQTSVGELVSGIERELAALDRFIAALTIDGCLLEDWRQSPRLREPLAERKNCSFISASVESAAFDGLCVLQEYIGQLKENAISGARAYRTGSQGAEAIFSSVFDGLMEAVKTMDAVSGFEKGRYAGIFRQDPRGHYGQMLLILEELNDANASGDAIHMADLLEHELAPFLCALEKDIFPSGLT